MPKSVPMVGKILSEIAPDLDLKINLEDKYGYAGQIITKKGSKFYFKNTNFDLNSQGAAEIARDKDYAIHFMKKMGYPVPLGKAFFSDSWCKLMKSKNNKSAALRYANGIGYPVIVKPNSKSQGIGVEKVYSNKDLLLALDYIFSTLKENIALVEEVVGGCDYRIVVLENEMVAAYKRVPLSVVGDGTKTVKTLLNGKNLKQIDVAKDIELYSDDPKIGRKLKRLGLKINSVLEKGKEIYLLDNANLSMGGTAEDVTEILHPSYKKIMVELVKDMGLRYAGVDIMTKNNVEKTIKDYTVLEINPAPQIEHFSGIGAKQKKVVKEMYKKILTALTKK